MNTPNAATPPESTPDHVALIRRLGVAQVASCKCQTKTPDPSFHKLECLYRVLNDAQSAILHLASVS